MGYLRRKLAEWTPSLGIALLLATVSLFRPEWLSPEAWVHEGICRELLAGTTEGRQALVGSGWYAPLPTLIGLPAVALLPAANGQPWAARVTAAAALAVLLVVVWRFAARRLPARLARWPWLAVVAMPFMGRLTGDPILAVTLAAATTALVKGADWCDGRRLTDLVKFAFALALLALCGFAPGGWTLLLLLMLPVTALAVRAIRPRFEGVLVLGALPVLYVLAVWGLMSRVIMIDGFYALRALRSGGAGAAAPLPAALAISGLVAAAASVAGVIRRRTVSIVLGLLGLALVGWWRLLQQGGQGWAATVAELATPLAASLSLLSLAPPAPRTRTPGTENEGLDETAGPARFWALSPLLFCALLAALAAHAPAPRAPTARALRAHAATDVLAGVTESVQARTPFGRVFVCGYGGLGLLSGRPRDLFVPCLDLHIDTLRRAYHGQHLFLLVPRPVGAAAVESLSWRYPDIYERGAPRALYDGDFGDWRLFELVTAPTAEQLDAWRREHLPAETENPD